MDSEEITYWLLLIAFGAGGLIIGFMLGMICKL